MSYGKIDSRYKLMLKALIHRMLLHMVNSNPITSGLSLSQRICAMLKLHSLKFSNVKRRYIQG
jgi:hypothetical protein